MARYSSPVTYQTRSPPSRFSEKVSLGLSGLNHNVTSTTDLLGCFRMFPGLVTYPTDAHLNPFMYGVANGNVYLKVDSSEACTPQNVSVVEMHNFLEEQCNINTAVLQLPHSIFTPLRSTKALNWSMAVKDVREWYATKGVNLYGSNDHSLIEYNNLLSFVVLQLMMPTKGVDEEYEYHELLNDPASLAVVVEILRLKLRNIKLSDDQLYFGALSMRDDFLSSTNEYTHGKKTVLDIKISELMVLKVCDGYIPFWDTLSIFEVMLERLYVMHPEPLPNMNHEKVFYRYRDKIWKASSMGYDNGFNFAVKCIGEIVVDRHDYCVAILCPTDFIG